MMEIDEIVQIIEDNCHPQNIRYIVISGGEPTIQGKPLVELVNKLRELKYHVTIESNGTEFVKGLSPDLMSMSPKLSSSTPYLGNLLNTGIEFNEKWAQRHERDRINIKTIQGYIDNCYTMYEWNTNVESEDPDVKFTPIVDYDMPIARDIDFQLKFVVTTIEDIAEIENDFLAHLKGVKPDDVCLMPEGVTAEDLMTKTKWVAEEALKRGWRFTPRLHVLMFGKNRYV